MDKRSAIVTGSNKGIGYAIVKKLVENFDGVVYLTSRNEQLGRSAVETMQKEVVSPQADLRYHQLDISDEVSVKRLLKHMQDEHGGIDVLINNAGIAFKRDSTAPFAEQAEVTNKTNYFGTATICLLAFPIIKRNGRIVNMSTQLGLLSTVPSNSLKSKLESDSLAVDELNGIATNFINAAKDSKHKEAGFAASAYGMSYVFITAFTRILGRQAAQSGRGVLVTCCCPGHVGTDMSSHKGPLTTDQGAETPVWLALIPAGEEADMNGKFFYKKAEKEWNSKLDYS